MNGIWNMDEINFSVHHLLTYRTREHQAPQPLSSAYISSALARHLSLTNTLQDPLAGKGLRRGSKMAASIRHRLQEGNGPFVEHCKAFEANFRVGNYPGPLSCKQLGLIATCL